jgi:hypothetical protein
MGLMGLIGLMGGKGKGFWGNMGAWGEKMWEERV